MEKIKSFFKSINYYYRLFNSFCTGPELNPNIFHPQFLIHRFMYKNLKYSASYAKGVMLDLGCGTKPYHGIFKEYVSAYYGLDIYTHRKALGFITAENASPNIFGDIAYLPFANQCVDTILCTQVLEHVPEPNAVIDEFCRILKEGGFVILTCPQSYPIHDKEHDYYRFTRFGISYILKKHGLRIEKILRHGGFFIEQALLYNVYFNYNLFKEGEGISGQRIILNIVKLVLSPILLLSNALINLSAIILDRFDPDLYFTHNYTVIARK